MRETTRYLLAITLGGIVGGTVGFGLTVAFLYFIGTMR